MKGDFKVETLALEIITPCICSMFWPIVYNRAELKYTFGQICVPMHLYGEILKFSFSNCIKDQWLKLTMYD